MLHNCRSAECYLLHVVTIYDVTREDVSLEKGPTQNEHNKGATDAENVIMCAQETALQELVVIHNGV